MRRAVLAATAVLACCATGAAAFWDAVISADEGTFDRIVTPEVTAIVKFDVKHPYGDAQMAWRKFAEAVGDLGMAKADVIFVEVNCLHTIWWNDPDHFNEPLARRYNVSFNYETGKQFKPAIMILRKGEQWNKPVPYTEKKIEKDLLLRWLQKFSADTMFGLTGMSQVMDVYARKFMRAGGGGDSEKAAVAREDILDEAMNELDALKAGRKRRATKKMKKLGLAGPYAPDLSMEESEEMFEKESTYYREKAVQREDMDYYVVLMTLVQEFGFNALIAERKELQEQWDTLKKADDKISPADDLKTITTPWEQRSGAKKSKEAKRSHNVRGKMARASFARKRAHFERLEARLNILSTFRSAGAVDFVNPDEVVRVREEKLEKFAKRRRQLTGRKELPASTLRKLKEEEAMKKELEEGLDDSEEALKSETINADEL